MFSNVLVGVDGRQGGRDAIALARQLAAPDAGITMAHVYGPAWMLGRGSVLALPLEREESERLLAAEREAAAIDAELECIGLVPPGRGLHELAERRGTDLLVVGSSRHALLGRALMGDDALAAFNGAPSAIAIAPRGYTQSRRPFRTLGVGYDSSPESEHALAAARELANQRDAAVKALWVVSLPDVRDEAPLPADWPETADTLVSRCSDQLRRLDDVDAKAVYGGPREELTRLSERVDLLIVGSRGYGPMRRLFHGSVSRYLLRHVACPLLVLPRTAPTEIAHGQEGDRTEAVAASGASDAPLHRPRRNPQLG